MRFEIKQTREKEVCTYKTLYLKRVLSRQIEHIAAEHHTSFNHVVMSMIEACLSEEPGTLEDAPCSHERLVDTVYCNRTEK